MERGSLGGAISKRKGRCYKQKEGAWAVLKANGKGLGGAISEWKGGAWAVL